MNEGREERMRREWEEEMKQDGWIGDYKSGMDDDDGGRDD